MDALKEKLTNYPRQPSSSSQITMEILQTEILEIPLTHFSDMINSLPNAPKPETNNTVRFEHKLFTCRSKPTSPRGIVLWSIRNEQRQVAAIELSSLYNREATELSDIVHTETVDPVITRPNKRRMTSTTKAKDSLKQALDQLSSTPTEAINMASQINLYDNFMCQFIQSGTIYLRVQTASRIVIVINDIDPTTGDFIPDQFVHTTRYALETGDYAYSCICEISQTSKESVALGEDDQDVIFVGGLQCPHCRIFHEEITMRLKNGFKCEPGLGQKLFIMTKTISKVVSLSSQRKSYKYSVAIDDEASFVSINTKGENAIIVCHAGMCGKGKQRSVKKLSEATGLCKHLQLFQDDPTLWNSPLVEADDTACPETDQVVSSYLRNLRFCSGFY